MCGLPTMKRITLSKFHSSTSKYVDTPTIIQKLNGQWPQMTPRWPLNPLLLSSHVQLYHCPKDHCVQVSWKCITVSHFKFTHSVHDYSTRCQISNTIVVPKFKSNAGLRMFHVRASHLCNNLPSNIRINFDAMSINQFKNSAFIQC